MKAMQEQANLLEAEQLLKKMGFKGSLLQPTSGITVENASIKVDNSRVPPLDNA